MLTQCAMAQSAPLEGQRLNVKCKRGQIASNLRKSQPGENGSATSEQGDVVRSMRAELIKLAPLSQYGNAINGAAESAAVRRPITRATILFPGGVIRYNSYFPGSSNTIIRYVVASVRYKGGEQIIDTHLANQTSVTRTFSLDTLIENGAEYVSVKATGSDAENLQANRNILNPLNLYGLQKLGMAIETMLDKITEKGLKPRLQLLQDGGVTKVEIKVSDRKVLLRAKNSEKRPTYTLLRLYDGRPIKALPKLESKKLKNYLMPAALEFLVNGNDRLPFINMVDDQQLQTKTAPAAEASLQETIKAIGATADPQDTSMLVMFTSEEGLGSLANLVRGFGLRNREVIILTVEETYRLQINAQNLLNEIAKDKKVDEILLLCTTSGGIYGSLAGKDIAISTGDNIISLTLIEIAPEDISSQAINKYLTQMGIVVRDVEAMQKAYNMITEAAGTGL
jgi:hypothetical protein